jgi:hypothetical protein
MAAKAKASAREVATLFDRLNIRDLARLRVYLQSYVDSQFYAVELMGLSAVNQIDAARKSFMCSFFRLPTSTAKNLLYVLFPILPSLYLLIQRRWKFYNRARTHDLSVVRDAFLFDSDVLYPNQHSWSFQTIQLLKEIGVTVDTRRMDYPRWLEEVSNDLNDVDSVCFIHVKTSTEKTLSLFRKFRTVDSARSFRSFLSSQGRDVQHFLLLFLTSGMRWRFFVSSGRGVTCPCCAHTFWSWNHFFDCPNVTAALDSDRFLTFVRNDDWNSVLRESVTVVRTWASRFDRTSLSDIVCDLLV